MTVGIVMGKMVLRWAGLYYLARDRGIKDALVSSSSRRLTEEADDNDDVGLVSSGYMDSNDDRTLQQEQGDYHHIHCSRERSRAAWKIIQEYLMPVVEKEKYNISRRCKLHPDNDLYRDQEKHKFHIDINEWRCEYCKKSFYEEKHLDLHFDNRHSNLLNLTHSRCLADICGALHCDHEMNSGSKKSKCNPSAAARNKYMCESLADSCFPINEGPANSSCSNSVMHTAALEVGNLSPGDTGYEEGKSSVEAYLTNQPEEKAILIDRSFLLDVLNLHFQDVERCLIDRMNLHTKSNFHRSAICEWRSEQERAPQLQTTSICFVDL
ncbi:hypothetical protein RIF29_00839 [Crotalaria pallida]|uniref:C2H2-type domain-containing protein n=1 Tax=Crotalaria pallida TaxID=3830 RepID=A0AAN9IW92_CROPI